MTMLTHARPPFERVPCSSGRRDRARAGAAPTHLAEKIKRFFIHVLVMLAAGGALTAIMALKVIIYLPHFNYH
jgi:hypothetical protein